LKIPDSYPEKAALKLTLFASVPQQKQRLRGFSIRESGPAVLYFVGGGSATFQKNMQRRALSVLQDITLLMRSSVVTAGRNT
jgi:hypothetical protein